ncbi:hypothetical protein CC1G_05187 [Coprinopsis cinerea okayama7|uniref:PHD-type domain-containing protein n=1 Tax=Coprinopsis cinerea (strain Okayama-7 / 130 / ATCC MYA-4618 / FGSC 9003) TaxID=240176 RepID=A8NG62_COPC7|nr:hypothetical protein CC1G_05187 [Coprinopsis cinerea okayama7\|eukprot:XP_001833487.2 hypothetical protein CC1G_05187 [Coprinopsis cinerea okayama7\
MATTAALPPYMLPGVPVHQPAHLEGDPSLATEILPGPPSLVSAQQSAQKRDPKKPSTLYSYLPTTDPGSTYSGVMHGTLIGLEEPSSKRPRPDKGNGNASGSGHQPIVLDAEPSGSGAVDDELVVSRSNSSLNLQDPPPQPTATKTSKRDKGKGKDTGTPPVRVKEEPKSTALNTPEPAATNLLNNNDHCSACRSTGSLVYCDGCPRAFHLWCLDPPMESIDEGDSRWFCPACEIRKKPPKKRPASLLAPLLHQLDMSIPVEFQLPDDIRNFFRDVGSGPRGAYVDLQEHKPPRLNRHGQLEERDPHRLKDRNGAPVLCFKCGMSALPTGLASMVPTTKRPRRAASKAVTPENFKDIVSCDFCSLHWHLDCLDPPLSAMPPVNKKWSCPNHAERLIPSKRRIPKHNASPIEVTKPRQWNNGHIDVIHPETSTTEARPRVQVDEVLINGRRYRVPEKIIILDFWNKVSKHDLSESKEVEMASGLSSPLTELSSLEDDEPSPPADFDEQLAAQVLFSLSHGKPSAPPATTTGLKAIIKPPRPPATATPAANGVASSSTSIPAAAAPPAPLTSTSTSVSTRPSRSAKKAASLKITSVLNTDLNGLSLDGSTPSSSVPRETAPPKATAPASSTRKTKSRRQTQAQSIQSDPSTRELRSRSRIPTQDSSSSVASVKIVKTNAAPSPSDSSATTAPPTFRTISVKARMEEVDHGLSLINGHEASSVSTNGSQPTTQRRPRQARVPAADVPAKERRSRKRKVREDELPEVNPKAAAEGRGNEGKRSKKGAKEDAAGRDKHKATVSTPLRTTTSTSTGLEITPTSSSRLPPLTPLTATPTLKIRLPRLGSTSKIAAPSLHG